MTRVVCVCVLGAAALLAGCGGGGDALGSGVDANKPVSEVSSEEDRQLCEAMMGYLRAQISSEQYARHECTVRGLSDGSTPEECASIRDDCLGGRPPRDLLYWVDCSTPFLMSYSDCGAPVASLESCWSADVDVYAAWLDMADCSLAGDSAAVSPVLEPPAVPSACTDAAALDCSVAAEGALPR